MSLHNYKAWYCNLFEIIVKSIEIQHYLISDRGVSRIPKTSKTEFIVELINGRKPLTNVIKSSIFDAAGFLDTHLSKAFHHGFVLYFK